jgi:ABC-type branched-subunit amino acid transport system substrate-binding protein
VLPSMLEVARIKMTVVHWRLPVQRDSSGGVTASAAPADCVIKLSDIRVFTLPLGGGEAMIRPIDRVGAVLGFRATIRRLAVIAIGVGMMLAPAAGAQLKTAKIAVALSLTGPNASLGKPELEGVRLAVEEANKSGSAPTIEISVHDDASNAERGRKIAREIGDSDALVVLGPSSTAMALNVGKIYSDTGVVAIGPSKARPPAAI